MLIFCWRQPSLRGVFQSQEGGGEAKTIFGRAGLDAGTRLESGSMRGRIPNRLIFVFYLNSVP